MKNLLLLMFLFPAASVIAQSVTLIPIGSSWKYLDNGSNQGTAWRTTGFNDASWATGNAELGYGDGGEATVVSYGTNSSYKHITTYFRKSFTVANAAAYTALTLKLLRDDGAVVYLNGTQVARSNMPSTYGYTTRALTSITGTGESTYYTYTPPLSLLVTGTNVIAVEIHQYNRTNADISFNLSLSATPAATCGTPGSLAANSVTSNSATVSWSAVTGATSYTVRYRITGTSTYTTLTTSSTSQSLTGLTSSVTYEYSSRATCPSGNGSYAPNSLFSTPAASVCGIPSDLTSNGVSSTGATVNWNAVSNATSYNVRYRTSGSSIWTTVAASSTSKILTGLAPATTYEFGVQAICSSGPGSFSSASTFTTAPAGNDSLITTFTSWKYLANGSNQGTAWIAPSFNDASWSMGNAELGYGDGDEATTVSYGSNASAKYITTYFRKSFNVTNPSAYASLKLNVVRDDGIVVYLNGAEVYRNNMPSGTISYTTLAPAAIAGTDESAWNAATLNHSHLLSGNNVLAVEIHQQSASSTDISFKAQLIGSGSAAVPVVTRGAYLQKVTPSSITIRWRTDIACDSRINFGTTTSYGNSVSDATATTEHSVTLTGLNSSTKYFYSIGTSSTILQGDAINNFTTSHPTGSGSPVRIWVTGDFGNGSTQQAAVRNAFATYNGSTTANLWLWLGDNAYATGTDAEYQSYVFNVYPDQLKSIPLYPSPGNHDYGNAGYQNSSTLTTNFPYFSNFSLPQTAEAGGVASNTPKYYSYNYGNIHFISLDSYGSYNNSTSAMYTWLNNDLAANTQRWTIVYFHHPPYTKGTHNSDADTELINMRTNIIPLLENYHVDLVLSGHSHVNERSYMIKGHYGTSTTFTSAMKIGTATNNFSKSPPFDGTVYAICGTSGQNPGTVQAGYPMPCMYFNNNTNNCSLVMDVSGDNLTCRYLTSAGTIVDQFSISKSGAREMAPVKPPVVTAWFDNNENDVVVEYFLEEQASVSLNIYSLAGQLIRFNEHHSQTLPSGFHRLHLDNSDLAPGIYLLTAIVNNEPHNIKINIPAY